MLRPILVALALSTLLAATVTPQAPAAKAGEFVWHDLVTPNPASCRAFYSALFGWTFDAGDGIDPGYTIIKHGKRPIGGIVTQRSTEGDAPAQWLTYGVVPDVDKAVAAFRDAGGQVFRGPLDARKDLRVAAVADAQGAPLGLASRGPYVAPPATPEINDWLWMEYVARDPAPALSFYAAIFGFRHEISEQRDNFTYHTLSTDRPRAGLFRSIFERPTSAWLPYVRVADPAAMAARVTQLGGTVLVAPQPRVRNNSLAIVLDPAGAPLALQKYPFDKGATP